MKRIEIFDPAMCCPTGLCGPNINPDLMSSRTGNPQKTGDRCRAS